MDLSSTTAIITTTSTVGINLTTVQIVAIAVAGVAALIIMVVCAYFIYRRFCRKRKPKTNRIGIQSDIISVPNSISGTKRSSVEVLENENENSKPMCRPTNISLEIDTISSKGRAMKSRKIRLIEFCNRIAQMHRDNDFMFQAEFDLINERSTTLPADRSNLTAMTDENIKKNRFVDVLPYEETLVKLEGESDYINASFIDGYNRPKEYIATQGPISEAEERQGKRTATMNDFWAMVWQYNCTSIVMLTQCVESFRYKCGQYWPSEVNGTTQYGQITVKLVEEIDRMICMVRKISITKDDESRVVTQWHFKEWEDARAPDAKHFLQFIDMVRMSPANKSEAPTVVHCSAGVGRSGAYIALDCLLQHVRDHDDVDVLSCVRELRSQRVRMVQTLEQYITLYDCLATAISKKLTEVDRDSKEDGFRSSQYGVASDQQQNHVVTVELTDEHEHPTDPVDAAESNNYHKEYRQSINSNDTLDI